MSDPFDSDKKTEDGNLSDEEGFSDAEGLSVDGLLLPIDEHEEFVSEGGKTIRRRGIYLLPNLLTLGALFAGFYAVIAGMSGDFNEAGWAILIAAIFDGLDGRIARLTNTQSAFGAQFDSLSDMVSFGVAPALIMFSWALGPLDRFGWAASFIYMSCAALRLARFNVQAGTVDKRFFVGLQSPLAAGFVTFVPWVGYKYGLEVTPLVSWLAGALTVFVGLLMISNYRYYSFKELHFRGTVPYLVFILAVVLLVVIAQNPHEMLLVMCVLYAFSGPTTWLVKSRNKLAVVPGLANGVGEKADGEKSGPGKAKASKQPAKKATRKRAVKPNTAETAVSEDKSPSQAKTGKQATSKSTAAKSAEGLAQASPSDEAADKPADKPANKPE